jgi:ribosomal protein S18 acetylase RimI-like enzyme
MNASKSIFKKNSLLVKDNFSIVNYNSNFFKDVAWLLFQLQKYVSSIDLLGHNFSPEWFWESELKRYLQMFNVSYIGNLTGYGVEDVKWVFFKVAINNNSGKVVWVAIWHIDTIEWSQEYRGRKISVLNELIVSEESRWSWLWKIIMEAFEEFSVSNDVNEIHLEVFGSNVSAIWFYKSIWFEDRMISMIKTIQ